MNRHDDRFSRGRRSEYERDDWRERQGRERTRESFYPGNYGFEEGEYSGRTAGGADEQPFSRNPYGYYPGQSRGPGPSGGPGQRSGRGWSAGQDRSREEWGDRHRNSGERYGSQRFGQREPYNAGGESSRSGPWRSEGRYGDDDYSRSGAGGSRYSESQYETEYGSGRGDVGGRYGSDYQPSRGDWRRRGESREYGRERYGMGPGARHGEERRFGEGPFEDMTESPGYFGTGYYGDGGASPTGGFDQRTRRRNYGALGEEMFSSDRDSEGWNRWTGRGGVSER